MKNPFDRNKTFVAHDLIGNLREIGDELTTAMFERTVGLVAHTGVMLFDDDPNAKAHRDRVREMNLRNQAYHYGKVDGGDSC